MATQLAPADHMAWKGKGTLLFIQKKYDEAIVAFDTAIQISPADAAKAWKGKGMALDALGKHLEAIRAYDEARKLGLTI